MGKKHYTRPTTDVRTEEGAKNARRLLIKAARRMHWFDLDEDIAQEAILARLTSTNVDQDMHVRNAAINAIYTLRGDPNCKYKVQYNELRAVSIYGETGQLAIEPEPAGMDECRGDFGRMLAQLDDRLQKVLRMKFVEEKTLKEIGKELGLSIQQTFKLVEAARSALREIYAAD